MKKRPALRLVDTRTLDRGQWLAVRQGGIGSSDAAAAVGLSPYKSQLELWLEKTGRATTKAETTGMDDPCYWGTMLEPYVETAYQQKTGRKVRRVNAVLQQVDMHGQSSKEAPASLVGRLEEKAARLDMT
jgi:putative phage-type endonuclease